MGAEQVRARSLYQVFGRCVVAAVAAGLAMAVAATPARAQQTTTTQQGTAQQQGQAAPDAQPGQADHTIRLLAGRSQAIDAPWPVARISVIDPSVADVDVSSPTRVQVQGKAPGATEILMWSEQDEIWQARVEVEADLTRLQSQLSRLFPRANLRVSQLGDVVVIGGTLEKIDHVQQLQQFMAMSDVKYLDATNVAGVQQVQLQVRVAEVSRQALRVLNVNAFYGGGDWYGGIQLGSSSSPFTPMNAGLPGGTGVAPGPGAGGYQALGTIGVPASATVFAGFPNSDLQVFLQALTENQYVRILAEPTLVARSGETATFLAGGEIPIPISESTEGSTQISIEYKEFGIRLAFRPTVLGNGLINLHVLPEVSELSDVGAIQILGARVPSLLTRRVETTLELHSGQTFAIAGLISASDNARVSKLPVLGDLPILGTLFRSVRYQTSETELLVLVTASLVEPISTDHDMPIPGDLHKVPSDWELYIDGKLEGRPAQISTYHRKQLQEMGLDELRGPGAWASYDDAPGRLAGEGGR